MPEPKRLLGLLNTTTPAIADYCREIANRGLGAYRQIVQTGAKSGRSYYSHVLNGVTIIEKLRPGLALSDPQTRLLFLGYTVHDINKVAEARGERGSYNALATEARFAGELEMLGAAAFLPDWRSYLADIAFLARAHQGHLAVVADGLNLRQSGRYRLPLAELERLGNLMKAVDCLDLSEELGETAQKQKFLAWVNAASRGRGWQWTWHRLAENRGILTNVVHNVLVDLLCERFQAIPLLYYPDGVAYLVPAEVDLSWDESDTRAAARAAGAAFAQLQLGELESFVTPTKDGIKVAAAAFESGAGLGLILDRVVARVYRKTYKADDLATYEANIRAKDLQPGLVKVAPEGQALLDELLGDQKALLTSDEGQLRAGELALAYKLLLGEYADQKTVKAQPWQRVYEVFELPQDVRAVANLVNATRRGRFLARWLDQGLESYIARVGADTPTQITTGGAEQGSEQLAAYLQAYLDLPFAAGRGRALVRALEVYTHDRHRQCCHCGSLGPADEWMSADVPASLGVQSFSNRLPGGVRGDPKRHVCPLCRLQYTLEKLAWVNHRDKQGQERRTFYLHLYPHGFFTEPLLRSWWENAQTLQREQHTAFLVDADSHFREWQRERGAPVAIHPTKINGVALPKLAETIGTTPVLPIHAPGQNYREQFLLAVETAVVLQRYFGCRVLLSRLPVPPLPATAVRTLFFEGVPAALRWLLPSDDFDAAAAELLFGRLRALHRARALLATGRDDPPIVLDLACAATDDPLRVYHVADQLIERRQRKVRGGAAEWTGIHLARELGPILEELASGRN